MELLNIIAKLLNVPVAKAQEFVDQEDEDGIIELNKANLKKRFDDGHKKATKEASKKVVDAIKSEFDIEINGETPDEIVNSIKEGLESRSADDISEEKIKASEPYKELLTTLNKKDAEFQRQVDKKVKETVKEKEKEYETGLKKAKRQALDAEVEREAEKWLVESKAILPEDPAKRSKLIKEFAAKLSADEIERDEDGKFIVSKPDGTPYTNKDGHPATLVDRFSDYDYLVNFQQVQQRTSTGLPPTGPGKPGQTQFQHFKGEVPKDEAGMNELRNSYLYDKSKGITKEALKEAEAAYEAAKTA